MADLFDTDVLIEYLRGEAAAIAFIEERLEEACISAITVGEIYQGVRAQEENQVATTLSAFRVLPVTMEIAQAGGMFSRDFRRSHGCGLADCLIAATATIHGLALQAFNKRHFPMIKNVRVPYARP